MRDYLGICALDIAIRDAMLGGPSASTAMPAKILVLGETGVGKTSLVRRLTLNAFSPAEATRGSKVVPFEMGEREAAFFEWPGGRLEVPQSANFVATLVVIDASDAKAANQDAAHWINCVEKVKTVLSHPKFLVSARIDRGSSEKDLQALTRSYRFDGVFHTSALTGTGIHELRERVRNAVAWPEEEEERDPTKAAVILAVRQLTETLCVLVAKDPNALRHMHWRQLEEIVAIALESIGFSVELTPLSKDGGKDIIATCRVSNEEYVFYVELKHWHEGGRPGDQPVADFVAVNLADRTNGGLFLSSSGYTGSVYGRLGEIIKQRVRLGEREKIVSLCQYFVRAHETCWIPQAPLPTVLFEQTLRPGGPTSRGLGEEFCHSVPPRSSARGGRRRSPGQPPRWP